MGGLQIDYKSALYRQTTRFLSGECGPLSRSPTKMALSTWPTHHHFTDRLQYSPSWTRGGMQPLRIFFKKISWAFPNNEEFFCFKIKMWTYVLHTYFFSRIMFSFWFLQFVWKQCRSASFFLGEKRTMPPSSTNFVWRHPHSNFTPAPCMSST